MTEILIENHATSNFIEVKKIDKFMVHLMMENSQFVLGTTFEKIQKESIKSQVPYQNYN